ncbi:DNA/RNA non-specific endonuclease [Dunaliella salina]|uniref:Endonuclease n=1 Tax=Dunaliella salina TaxID=3046 RepID=A0ABQ7G760_DUNSA|nr:DNA/RNA non-specific endonuclease [Dunaliella salina]|eukprot:KAF5830433.1 DNA/RNA non-specific endonuclease [Dunaliella salina]
MLSFFEPLHYNFSSLAGFQHEALKYGMPETESVQVHDGFVTAFDFRTRNPKWVLEHITAEILNGSAERTNTTFFEDKGIDQWLRSRLDDYKDSGYDRGHLAPAADFRSSQKAMDQTFTLSNISPQVGQGFNRDYWARFEHFIRGVARRCQEVRVVTGPLWLPSLDADGKWYMRHNMIGTAPSLVSVPTHFYKVVTASGSKAAASKGDNRIGVAAFVMPNAPIDPRTPLSAFVVPLEALEAAAGTRFFPGLVSNGGRRALDDAAHGFRALGLQQMRPFDRLTLEQHMLPAPEAAQAPHLTASSAASRQAREAIRLPSANNNTLAVPSTSGSTEEEGALSKVTVPKTKMGFGVVHLCEVESCRLPIERFWEGNSNSENSSSAGGASRAKGGSGR